ncbi:MAG: hypothetical protein IIU65_01890 [Clostridia bacterium]|nr:hypothetical protein [Clostridia bacterium]
MYKNIGRKIKGFSIVLAWTLIAVSCFYAFYRLFNGTIDTKNIIISVAIVLVSSIVAMLLSWFIYAYGVLAENAEKSNDNLETLILQIDELSSKLETREKPSSTPPKKATKQEDFSLPETKEELFASQLKKLKKDYEMSRITYDEYEEAKKLLEEKYR